MNVMRQSTAAGTEESASQHLISRAAGAHEQREQFNGAPLGCSSERARSIHRQTSNPSNVRQSAGGRTA